MSLARSAIRNTIRRFGFEITRTPPADPKPSGPTVAELCLKKEVELIEPISLEAYRAACPPLLPELVKVPPNFPVKVHQNLSEAVDNVSMRNYVRLERKDDELWLTDVYPGSHYYSRQRMLYSVYQRAFGKDLAGKTLLDIGCSSGYYCFYASKLGAKSVLGFDVRPEHEEQFALLHTMLKMPDSCAYRHLDMEHGFEALDESFDMVLAMGTMYHVYDHARFIKNLYRTSNRFVVLEGECSGTTDNFCLGVMEETESLRSGIYGPVIFPSVPWTIDLLRWAGFRNIKYVKLPAEVEDRWGFNQFRRVMLFAEK